MTTSTTDDEDKASSAADGRTPNTVRVPVRTEGLFTFTAAPLTASRSSHSPADYGGWITSWVVDPFKESRGPWSGSENPR